MGLWAKSVVIFNAIVTMASRASGAWRIEPAFPKAAYIAVSRQSIVEIATRSRRFGSRGRRTWLIRLVVATLFVFGLKQGVGAETLSEFFGHLSLRGACGVLAQRLANRHAHAGTSPAKIAAAWEKDGIAHGEIRPVIGAVDETFLQRMMLVFMDLATGYLLMEEVAVDRSFDTWLPVPTRA